MAGDFTLILHGFTQGLHSGAGFTSGLQLGHGVTYVVR